MPDAGRQHFSRLVANFPNFHLEECDGTDLLASLAAMRRAVEYVRAGNGPALVHGHVIRPYSHSLSDDQKLYRPEGERNAEAERDPISALCRSSSSPRESRPGAAQKLHARESTPRCTRPAMRTGCSLPRDLQLRPSRVFGGLKAHGAEAFAVPAARARATTVPWPTSSIPACVTRCGATSASWSLAKTSPTANRESTLEAKLKGQGWSLQAHRRVAARVRLRARLQLAAGRGQHRGPRPGYGRARPQAGGGNSVLRLHLAGHAPATR